MTDNQIHWWKFPLDTFSIKLNEYFKNRFFEELYRQRSTSLNLAKYLNKQSKKYGRDWNYKKQRAIIWVYKKTKFIPAWVIYHHLQQLLKEKKIIKQQNNKRKQTIFYLP